MSEQIEKKFTWVLKKFSSVQDERCYSRPFTVAGCNWHLIAYRKRNNYGVFLELADPASLPPGWRREVNFSLTLVNKGWGKSNRVLEGQCCFDAKNKSWGYSDFVSLTKLHATGEGFLVNNKLIIVAEVHVLPEEPVKIIEQPLNSKEDDASEESLDDEDGDTSEESSDGDGASEEEDDGPVSEDGGRDISPLNQTNVLEDATQTVANDGIRCNSVEAETEVSNGESDDASSLISNDSAIDGSSLDQAKSSEDASQTVEKGGTGFNNMASVTETSNKLIKEIQPVKGTMDVNGFEVSSAQVESVSHIFRRHPDIALDFRPKNQQIRKAYLNELLSLIEMLCQSPEKLSEDDLSNADDTLVDLIDVGFKLDWLKTKLKEVSEKKKLEQGSGARLRTMEEQLQKLKLMFLDLETQLQKEKVEALAARVPLSFNDVVC